MANRKEAHRGVSSRYPKKDRTRVHQNPEVGDRTIVHERSYYDLTLASSDEDGAYLIALVQVDDNLTPLAPGILCAKLDPDVDRELAGQLIDHLNALVDCWEMNLAA